MNEDTCEYVYKQDKLGYWWHDTSCYHMVDSDNTINDWTYCPFCGKRIRKNDE